MRRERVIYYLLSLTIKVCTSGMLYAIDSAGSDLGPGTAVCPVWQTGVTEAGGGWQTQTGAYTGGVAGVSSTANNLL